MANHQEGPISVDCFRCGKSNPDEDKYCGRCGAPLDPTLTPLKDFIAQEIRNAIIKERLKDQETVEFATSEKILERVANWAKLFGFFAGIPLTLLLLVLGLLGIKNYSDVQAVSTNAQQTIAANVQKVETQTSDFTNAQPTITANVHQVETQTSDFAQKRSTLSSQQESFSHELADFRTQIAGVNTKVDKIAERINLECSGALPASLASLAADLKTALSPFQQYIFDLGFRPRTSEVCIGIDQQTQNPAYYNSQTDTIVVASAFATDRYGILREYAAHALLSISAEQQGGSATMTPEAQTIESGMADYLVSSFTNDPVLGKDMAAMLQKMYGSGSFSKPYIRNLNNDRKFTDVSPSTMPQDAGEIWGGAFWDIRSILGQSVADRLLFSTWGSLDSADLRSNSGVNFVNKLLAQDQKIESQNHVQQIRTAFERRGLKL